MFKNFKEIGVIVALTISAYFSLNERYFPLQFAISLFITWKFALVTNDKNLEMFVAFGVIVIFGITLINYNKKVEQESLSIETKVKIAQEKCIYEYKIDELKIKDSIGMLTDSEIKIEYNQLKLKFDNCLEKINQKIVNNSGRSRSDTRLLKNLGYLDKDGNFIDKNNK